MYVNFDAAFKKLMQCQSVNQTSNTYADVGTNFQTT